MASDSTRRMRSAGIRLLLPILVALAGWTSPRMTGRFGRAIGRLSWRFSGREPQRALEHLALAFPESSAEERETIGRRCFEHQGTNLVECLRLLSKDAAEVRSLVELSGWEHVEKARGESRPILILTGHCGNFELLAARLNSEGLGMSAIAAELDDPVLQAALLGLRARFGTESIVRSTSGSARKMLKALRADGALGILIDQDTQVDGVWVPFFGRLAYTPVGAAEIALRRGAVVLPTFIERRPDSRHVAQIHPALTLSEDPTEATAQMTAAIEAQIRRSPEQWVWMHRRWRRRPESES